MYLFSVEGLITKDTRKTMHHICTCWYIWAFVYIHIRHNPQSAYSVVVASLSLTQPGLLSVGRTSQGMSNRSLCRPRKWVYSYWNGVAWEVVQRMVVGLWIPVAEFGASWRMPRSEVNKVNRLNEQTCTKTPLPHQMLRALATTTLLSAFISTRMMLPKLLIFRSWYMIFLGCTCHSEVAVMS